MTSVTELRRTVYVVFGQAKGFDTSLDLSSLDSTNDFQINGAAAAIAASATRRRPTERDYPADARP